MKKFEFNYQKINSKLILSVPEYQRTVDFARVKKIVSNFNPNLVNPIKVSFRDGKYYVFDGQHTLKALVLRNKGKDLLVECKVYRGLTYEDEARLFSEQNGICRQVTTQQKLLSLYEANDIDVVEFRECVEQLGIRCSFKKINCGTDCVLSCYAGAYGIYTKQGKEQIVDVLKTILDVWNGEGASFRKEIVMGMNIFITTYSGQYDRKKLVKNLSRVSPVTIFRDGKSYVTGGNKRFARQILTYYNKNATKNRLEDVL